MSALAQRYMAVLSEYTSRDPASRKVLEDMWSNMTTEERAWCSAKFFARYWGAS